MELYYLIPNSVESAKDSSKKEEVGIGPSNTQ